mgnify:CR=1 FL=1
MSGFLLKPNSLKGAGLQRKFYQGVSLTQNIEDHASAPLYPLNATHPHPKYQDQKRLIIKSMPDPELRKKFTHIQNQLQLLGSNRNPLDYIKVADLTCPCDNKILYEQIFGDPIDQQDEVMAYKSCKHTIYAAAKRQMKAAPTPDPKIADEFIQYAIKIIEEEMGDALTDFGYSYQQWYHHLEAKKQHDMDLVSRYNQHDITLTDAEIRRVEQMNYEGICKVELQETNGKPRMVCSIPLMTKHTMGPVTWALEELASKHLRGYCGGKNLEQMGDEINKWAALGFTKVVGGDGSAFDNCQDVTLKEVDRYLYRRIRDKIHHTSIEKFDEISQEIYKTMDVVYTDKDTKQQKVLFTYSILGTVFSGDADTTLCNTMRMALYNRFVNDKAGLIYGEDYVCFAKGDDFYCLYKPYVQDDFIKTAYYKYFLPANPDPSKPDTRVFGLGQVLKMLDFGDLSTLNFCSLRSWFIGPDKIILTRDPKKFFKLSKYSRKTKTLTPQKYAQYLLQQALCLNQVYKGIKIFDTMAEMYTKKARQVLIIYNCADQYKSVYQKAVNFVAKDSRQLTSKYQQEETSTYKILNFVKERETCYKIFGSYWETMKMLEEQADYSKLSPEQLQLVNQQIEAEFSSEELKSVLGYKNFDEH